MKGWGTMIYFNPMTSELANLTDGLEEAKGFIEQEDYDEAIDTLTDIIHAIRNYQLAKEEE